MLLVVKSYAVVDPGTVMVHFEYTAAAGRTVMGSSRSHAAAFLAGARTSFRFGLELLFNRRLNSVFGNSSRIRQHAPCM